MRNTLNSYAPGDGALDFCYVDSKGQATGKVITRRIAQRHLDSPKQENLRRAGFKVFYIDGRWRMVKTMERTAPDTLRLNVGYPDFEVHDFRYVLTGESKEGCVYDPDMTVYSTITVDGESREIEVKNWSIRAAMRFWLNHEKELSANVAPNSSLAI